MLIKKEILKNLCPVYIKEIEKLEQEYAEIPECDRGIKKDCLLKFSQNYLMLKELWDTFFDESRKEQAEASFTPNISQLVQTYLNNKIRSRYHFYILNGNDGYKKLWHETPNFNTSFLLDYSEIRLQLNLPQKGLEHTLKFFDEHSCEPLPKEAYILYTKAKELYSKILIADNKSDEEWFNLIIEVKDIEFVANNIEWRIGNNNLNCQKLWKLYLRYLEKNDTKVCAFFYYYCMLIRVDHLSFPGISREISRFLWEIAR
uniref:Uncharacterized protein n=1 Tax=Panagrolaimus davidi TaxID=227884 RepID=A0A914R2L9_9BILA